MQVANSPYEVDDFIMEYENVASMFKACMTKRCKGNVYIIVNRKVVMQNKICHFI